MNIIYIYRTTFVAFLGLGWSPNPNGGELLIRKHSPDYGCANNQNTVKIRLQWNKDSTCSVQLSQNTPCLVIPEFCSIRRQQQNHLNKCWLCTFLQTTDMMKLNISWWLKKHSLRLRKRYHFGLKYLVLMPQAQLENVQTVIKPTALKQ